jgi:hypothetical protein
MGGIDGYWLNFVRACSHSGKLMRASLSSRLIAALLVIELFRGKGRGARSKLNGYWLSVIGY